MQRRRSEHPSHTYIIFLELDRIRVLRIRDPRYFLTGIGFKFWMFWLKIQKDPLLGSFFNSFLLVLLFLKLPWFTAPDF